MTDKELIKQEIERRKSLADEQKNNGYFFARSDAYMELLNFIDSMTEEPASEDLEEYYKKEFLPNEWFAKPGQRTISEFNFFTAKHFAEWQKQQMIKDAVNANVYEGLFNKYLKEQDEGALSKALASFENRDRVKIIIVKED